ncbi:hypothetical protein [Pseudoduganella namucuonensis]|uniref:Lipoprotein n=1 Tax=Pseudoduganella namucuonensis TaxID=1035707 RepID=A0A1I7M395_9BURK|nr:hypothetical protein [Pseudoduganella namucuonensis]SFV16327.1 hypothetical protein SAMN05216552_105120 [Pseudoduganella namucuonensis]
MKRLLLFAILPPLLLGACSHIPFLGDKEREQAAEAARRAASERKPARPELASDGSKRLVIDGVEIERVEFRAGVSSATVENMAKQGGCVGGPGAGLVSQPGPVEIYRMVCGDGRTYLAKCELRQCKPLR